MQWPLKDMGQEPSVGGRQTLVEQDPQDMEVEGRQLWECVPGSLKQLCMMVVVPWSRLDLLVQALAPALNLSWNCYCCFSSV